MYSYWDDQFIAWPPEATVWLNTLIGTFENPTGIVFKEIAALLALIGLIWLLARRSPYAVMFTLPVAIAWGASVAQAYPFFERLILYLAPLLALIVGCGVAAIADVLQRYVRWHSVSVLATAAMAIVLLTRPVTSAALRVQTNETFYGFDVRETATYFKAHRQPEDFLYLHWLLAGSYKYYGYRLGIDRGRLREGPINDLGSWAPTIEDVSKYSNVPRMWFMVADLPPNNTDTFADTLKARGTQLDYMKSRSINLWLFSLN